MIQEPKDVLAGIFERMDLITGLDFTPTIHNVVSYYKRVEKELIEFNKKRPFSFYYAYAFDWMQIFTPIEFHAWHIIRSMGRIVLYPQYPVMNYRPDFANPVKKIILECDGKDFHDAKRDLIRDTNLMKQGWRVFRLPGRELYKTVEIDYDEYGNVDNSSLRDYYMLTAEGVIEAIRAIYFEREPFDYEDATDDEIRNYRKRLMLQYETLEHHKLADFGVAPIEY